MTTLKQNLSRWAPSIRFASRLSLKFKLTLCALALLLSTLAVSLNSAWGIRELVNSVKTLSSNGTASDWLAQTSAARIETLQYLWVAMANYSQGRPSSKEQINDFLNSAKTFSSMLGKFTSEATLSPKQNELVDKVAQQWKTLTKDLAEFSSEFASGKAYREDLIGKLNGFSDRALSVNDTLSELQGLAREDGSAAAFSAQKVQNLCQMLSLIVIGVSILIGLAVLFFVSILARKFAELSRTLSGNAVELASAASQFNETSTTLAGNTNEQSAAVEETSVSLNEILKTVEQNAGKAGEAETLSKQGLEMGNTSESNLAKMLHAMSAIDAASGRMESIISVIEDIAFQTNILSLNASVEAARAGQHGKGFAVVAEAVRGLAQKSSLSAKEIARLIKENKDFIEAGKSQAEESARLFARALEASRKINDLNREIAAASRAQKDAIHEMTQAMEQINQSTQSTAAAAEEISASSKGVTRQASSIRQSINVLVQVTAGEDNLAAQKQA